MKKIASATDPLWYKDAIIYELHVRAFADSNDDGIGDFPGLLSRLDYLQDLGVTCIWLLPFFPSPLRDDGYDIANYVDVNPSYGTLNDFKAFLEAAHQRDMQVMIELVINHTSDQHPWFKAARLAPPGSPAARYVRLVRHRPALQGRAHHLHRHGKIQLDLGRDRQGVLLAPFLFASARPQLTTIRWCIEEVLKAMRFWLDMGVDALRMDAIPYLVRARRHLLRKPAARRMASSERSAPPSTPTTPTASFSPKPTSGPPTCAPTSATATSATWHSTFR